LHFARSADVTEGFSTVHEQGLQLDTKPESHK
jgi:hypothetical protein